MRFDYTIILGGAHAIVVLFIRDGISDPSSNSGQGCLHFTLC